MSLAADLTVYIGTFVSISVAGGTFWAWRRKNRDAQDMTDVVSFESLNKALNNEVARVNKQLADQKVDYEKRITEMEGRHRDQLKALEADYEQRHATLRARMADLETDNASLNRQLVQARRWTDPNG